MARYIDADKEIEKCNRDIILLIKAYGDKDNYAKYKTRQTRNVIEALRNAPTADVVEVVHGEWKPHYETFDEDKAVGLFGGEYQTGWQCSVCGRYEPSEEPYCNCGAKMNRKKVE